MVSALSCDIAYSEHACGFERLTFEPERTEGTSHGQVVLNPEEAPVAQLVAVVQIPLEIYSAVAALSPENANLTGVLYTATIHAPNGNFHDEGTSSVNVTITGSAATLTESFTASLAQPVPIAPTSKDQCKNGGWQAFPQFKNQGQCVSFVESKPQT